MEVRCEWAARKTCVIKMAVRQRIDACYYMVKYSHTGLEQVWCDLFTVPDQKWKINIQSRIDFPRDINQYISITTIINLWNKKVVNILGEERNGIFLSNVTMLSRLPKPVELSHKWVLKNSSIRSQNFTLYDLMSHKKFLLKFLQDAQMLV